jgi:hypothetical protein
MALDGFVVVATLALAAVLHPMVEAPSHRCARGSDAIALASGSYRTNHFIRNRFNPGRKVANTPSTKA